MTGRGPRRDGRPHTAPADPEVTELLSIATRAARQAALLLAARGPDERPTVVATKSSPTDVVTEMDRQAEAVITEVIRTSRPSDAILAEEGGETSGDAAPGRGEDRQPAPVRWIVDPLDGTVNYLYGLPDWAVSIAVEVAGTVVAGVVDVPRRAEVFTATLGGGAWLHRSTDGDRSQRLHCTRGVPLGQALVATGFGYDAGRRRVQGQVAAALLPRIRDIRRGGSAAVDLCLVAAGRLDAFYERGLNYWDYAAGALIAREAGARVGGLAGKPAGSAMTIAADPALYAELCAALTALHPERDD